MLARIMQVKKDIEKFELKLNEALKKGLNLNLITDNDKNDGNLPSRYFVGSKTFLSRRQAIEYLITQLEKTNV